MADVYDINEAPTVLQGPANPLSIYLNQQAQRARNQYNQDRLNYQAQQAREKGFGDLMKMDLTKPGYFQREQSVNEENDYRKKIADMYFNNPNISPNEVRYMTQDARSEVERKRAKRMEIGDTLKNVMDVAKKDKNIDPTALANVMMREHNDFDPKSGSLTPKEIDQIDREKLADTVNHPSVYKADSAIMDFANKLKSGISEGKVGPEFAQALGTAREGIFGKMKFFQTDANGNILRDDKGMPIPGISQNLIDYVKEADPKIESKYLWEIARQQHEAAGGNPDDLQSIDKIYEHIAFDPDQKEKYQPMVDQRIKQALGVHQRLEHSQKITSTGTFKKNNGVNTEPETSFVGGGDGELRDFSKIDQGDKTIGFKNQDIGFTGSDKFIQFAPVKGGEKNAYGRFTGFRTNPTTGAKEMVMAVKSFDANGNIAEVPTYVPYDEATLNHVKTSLKTKADQEKFDKVRKQFNEDFKNREEYKLDDSKLDSDTNQIVDYYNKNKDKVGSEEFNQGFQGLINQLGLDKGVKSNKTFWWFNPNEITIGDQTIPVTDKEKIKQVLYDSQKGRYKKLVEKGTSNKEFSSSKGGKFDNL